MENFETGANRNESLNKIDYEGHIHPAVLKAYGEYMHQNRFLKDGTVRDSDNWQLGIPQDKYMKSLIRHTFELWYFHRTGTAPLNVDTGKPFTKRELLSAIMFNVMGYFKEYLSDKKLQREDMDAIRERSKQWVTTSAGTYNARERSVDKGRRETDDALPKDSRSTQPSDSIDLSEVQKANFVSRR